MKIITKEKAYVQLKDIVELLNLLSGLPGYGLIQL